MFFHFGVVQRDDDDRIGPRDVVVVDGSGVAKYFSQRSISGPIYVPAGPSFCRRLFFDFVPIVFVLLLGVLRLEVPVAVLLGAGERLCVGVRSLTSEGPICTRAKCFIYLF